MYGNRGSGIKNIFQKFQWNQPLYMHGLNVNSGVGFREMKKAIGILVLVFFLITPSQADDIRDFQIEGMSMGDSFLDYFSEEEIKKNSGDYYKNKTFTPFEIYKKPFFKVYEFVGGAFKTEDNNYIFHHIKGVIEYPNDIKSCYKKMDEISKEISEILEYVEGVKVKK